MSSLIGLSIDLTKIDKSKLVNGKYLNLTLSVQDEVNAYGQNASAYHEQSKEEREAKVNRNYIGNGKVIWTDGNIVKAEKQQIEGVGTQEEDQDLPF